MKLFGQRRPAGGLGPGPAHRGRTPGRLLVASLALLVGLGGLLVPPTVATAAAVQYTNPLANRRADTQIYKHTDGFYYMTATVPEYDRIVLRRATTLQGLASAPETVIWRKHPSGIMGAHIWAPEIHFINGKWYVYFAAGASNAIWAIRMYVLEASGANPLTSPWVEKGQIRTPWETFALDASTFVHNGVRYLIWAQAEPGINSNSNVYIARLSNPWTLGSAPTRIAVPTRPWEINGSTEVNEGPTVIQRNGRLFMTFSASTTDARYCLGLLTASATANLLSASSWVKSPNPVFVSNAATGQYGPGHNSFTVSEDGRSDILVYHDRNYRDINGDPLKDPNRRTRLQKLYWNADGTPNFGIPVPDGSTPVRLRSHNLPESYIRHWEFRAKLEPNVTNLADSQFRIVTGLAGPDTVSLESTNFPGYYLRRRNVEVWVDRNDESAAFRADASFRQRPGLAAGGAVSFEASDAPGHYLRHRDGLLYVQPVTGGDRADATFHPDPGGTGPDGPGEPSPTASPTASPTPSPTASPTASPSATPSGTPTGSPTVTPTRTPGAGRPGGDLPTTGTDVVFLATGGAVLLILGVALSVWARRRRVRFRSDTS